MKKKIIIGGIIACILLGGGGILAYYLLHTEAIFTEQTIELGENYLSEEVRDYISGSDQAIAGSVVDISKVNFEKVGDYEVTCTTKRKTYSYTIHIVDTTAPELVLNSDKFCCQTDYYYKPTDFVTETSDLSGEVKLLIEYNGILSENINFDKVGNYTFTIVANDSSGNSTKEDVTYEFAKAPKFMLLTDKSIETGTEFDPMMYAFAYDELDGNLKDDIVVDLNGFDREIPGDYKIKYSVTNGKGIEKDASIKVTVGDITDYNIDVSDEDMDFLLEYGYFTYEPLEEENFELAKELVRNTNLTLLTSGYLDQTGGCCATGAIYKITKDYVYIVTNEHVSRGLRHWNDGIVIMFPDKDTVKIDDGYEFMDNDVCDISVLSVPVEKIPDDKLLLFKEVYFDEDLDFSPDMPMFVNSVNWRAQKDMIVSGTLYEVPDNKKQGYLSLIGHEGLVYKLEQSCPTGTSGSGDFDFKGNFIGVHSCSIYLSGIHVDGGERLNDILQFIDEKIEIK